jgi:hypothetical protein
MFVYYGGQTNTDEEARRLTEVARRQRVALTAERICRVRHEHYCEVLGGLPHLLPRIVQPRRQKSRNLRDRTRKLQGQWQSVARASSPASASGVPPGEAPAPGGGTPPKLAGEDARATLSTACDEPTFGEPTFHSTA